MIKKFKQYKIFPTKAILRTYIKKQPTVWIIIITHILTSFKSLFHVGPPHAKYTQPHHSVLTRIILLHSSLSPEGLKSH